MHKDASNEIYKNAIMRHSQRATCFFFFLVGGETLLCQPIHLGISLATTPLTPSRNKNTQKNKNTKAGTSSLGPRPFCEQRLAFHPSGGHRCVPEGDVGTGGRCTTALSLSLCLSHACLNISLAVFLRLGSVANMPLKKSQNTVTSASGMSSLRDCDCDGDGDGEGGVRTSSSRGLLVPLCGVRRSWRFESKNSCEREAFARTISGTEPKMSISVASRSSSAVQAPLRAGRPGKGRLPVTDSKIWWDGENGGTGGKGGKEGVFF